MVGGTIGNLRALVGKCNILPLRAIFYTVREKIWENKSGE